MLLGEGILLIHVLAVLCDSRKGSVGDLCSGSLIHVLAMLLLDSWSVCC